MTDTQTPQALEIAGEQIPITPLRVGEIPRVLELLTALSVDLSADGFDWLRLFGADAPALLGAIAIACRKPRDWVEGLLPDEAVRLGTALIEVNADFFAHRLAPEMERAARRLAMPGGGIAGSASSAASD